MKIRSGIVPLIILITLLLAIVPKVSSYSNFTYQEKKSSSVIPRIWRTYVYDDGTILVRIVRRDAANSGGTRVCLQQVLSLRLIYPNGTVSELDIDLNIQSFNYCLIQATPINLEPIRLYTLQPATGAWNPDQSTVRVNITPKKGFLRLSVIRNTTNLAWAQYFIDSNYKFQTLSSGTIELPIFASASFNTIATVDDGYAIVYANSSDPSNTTDPLIIRAALYIQTIGYGEKTLGSPLLLYQIPIQNILFGALYCDVSHVNVGQICTLTIQQNVQNPNTINNATQTTQPTPINNNNTYYAKIAFLSGGSVTEFTPISRTLPIIPNITQWVVTDLPYGGYLLVAQAATATNVNINAYVFDEYSTTGQPWDLPEPATSNVAGSYLVLPNNSVIVAQPESLNTWLTMEGTTYYESLNSSGTNKFFYDLQDEVSKILPVTPSRLSSNKHVQVDFSISPGRQIFLLLNIEQTRDKDERSVASLIRDLNTMIHNKDITPIGSGNIVKYLDDTYGFIPSSNLWDKYKLKLLGVFVIACLLIFLFLMAQRRDKKGHNIAILQLGLILFDLTIDILFLVNNGRDVEFLYIPSVVFLVVPLCINTTLAFMIITKENTRPEFFSWFVQNGKIAAIFTVLAGADIEALAVLRSNLAGFGFFQAPFSEEALSKIFWGACLNIFMEDIPQVIIQILYQRNTVIYDIIPLLTLVSSCLNLTINIIGRLYQATNRIRQRKQSYSNYPNTSEPQYDFGSAQPLQMSTPNSQDESSQKIDFKNEQLSVNSDLRKLAKSNSTSSFQEMINH
ncbi:7660_t:CDS:2 [Gigaspora margarita]|uniref:7660_t:CDS:1 n=1 Tax=Gigaspora margarita TaxID=4874 RepID=A0ABN7UK73_GIGMA|nr:7660_t:CDS:2 [Gigaspora margarita]